jgi:hypothetical protein
MKSTENAAFQSRIGDSAHHRWGWHLAPLPSGGTRVTEFFDCTDSPQWLREATKNGEAWRATIQESLSRLAERFDPASDANDTELTYKEH